MRDVSKEISALIDFAKDPKISLLAVEILKLRNRVRKLSTEGYKPIPEGYFYDYDIDVIRKEEPDIIKKIKEWLFMHNQNNVTCLVNKKDFCNIAPYIKGIPGTYIYAETQSSITALLDNYVIDFTVSDAIDEGKFKLLKEI
jgi:hypothetical protein